MRFLEKLTETFKEYLPKFSEEVKVDSCEIRGILALAGAVLGLEVKFGGGKCLGVRRLTYVYVRDEAGDREVKFYTGVDFIDPWESNEIKELSSIHIDDALENKLAKMLGIDELGKDFELNADSLTLSLIGNPNLRTISFERNKSLVSTYFGIVSDFMVSGWHSPELSLGKEDLKDVKSTELGKLLFSNNPWLLEVIGNRELANFRLVNDGVLISFKV